MELACSRVFTPDARSLWTSGDDETLRLWSMDGDERRRVFAHAPGKAFDLRGVPGSHRFASSGSDGRTLITSGLRASEILFWHLPTGESLGRAAPVLQGALHVKLSADEAWILVYQWDGTVRTIPSRTPRNPIPHGVGPSDIGP